MMMVLYDDDDYGTNNGSWTQKGDSLRQKAVEKEGEKKGY
jgi:hypothetical protein